MTHLGTADAPSVEDHIGRYRRLAEVGVQSAIVSFPEPATSEAVTGFADVIAAFRPAGAEGAMSGKQPRWALGGAAAEHEQT